MKTLLIALTAMALTGTALYFMSQPSSEEQLRSAFLVFKAKHNKSYGSKTELEFRFEVFKLSVDRIQKSNADSANRFRLAVNKFADLTFPEFRNQYLLRAKKNPNFKKSLKNASKPKKGKKDWRKVKHAVGPVKNQEQCGSCWAFSTNASLEFAYFKQTGKTGSFSEQELVDCAGGKYENEGCNGGLMDTAYDYIIDHSIDTEKTYPYRAVDQKCKASKKKSRFTVKSYSYLKPANVVSLVKAAQAQVVSVAIEVQDDFMFYDSGVYHAGADCGEELDHGVAVVGYNTKVKDGYFIVRNSWGADWGLEGYIKMAVGTGEGTCGIAGDSDVYPNL